MRRTSAFFISLLFMLFCNPGLINAQDTIIFPLKIKVGLEVSGPVTYFIEKTNQSAEGYISADINEKITAVISGGYLDYKYTQYNYSYLNNGIFLRTGVDFNLLKPDKAMGKYWAGVGVRYGISRFTAEFPSFQSENYWGIISSSIPRRTSWAHFLEASPGVRAELFRNVSIGWNVSLRMLLYTGSRKDIRPIYFAGFGDGQKSFAIGISYFLVWNIPYKKITVIIKKEVPPEPEEPDDTKTTGNGQQTTGVKP
jgi:Domain of unknown function (DUF6048)